MTAELTPKQQRFITEYLDCLCATKAARRADHGDLRHGKDYGVRTGRHDEITAFVTSSLNLSGRCVLVPTDCHLDRERSSGARADR